MRALLLVLLAAASSSCTKQPEDPHPYAQVDERAPEIAEPPRGPFVPLRLERLSLVIDAPPGAKVVDRPAGGPAMTVSVAGCPIDVDAVTSHEDLAAARQRVDSFPDAFHRFTVAEERPGGWRLEYQRNSMVEKRVTYGVLIRTTIAGVAYQCGREAPSEGQRDCAARACRSLRR